MKRILLAMTVLACLTPPATANGYGFSSFRSPFAFRSSYSFRLPFVSQVYAQALYVQPIYAAPIYAQPVQPIYSQPVYQQPCYQPPQQIIQPGGCYGSQPVQLPAQPVYQPPQAVTLPAQSYCTPQAYTQQIQAAAYAQPVQAVAYSQPVFAQSAYLQSAAVRVAISRRIIVRHRAPLLGGRAPVRTRY